MFTRLGIFLLLVGSVIFMSTESVNAQGGAGAAQMRNIQSRNSISQFSVGRINAQVRNQAVPAVGVAGVNQQRFFGGPSPLAGGSSKPFTQLDRGPSVSPYLTLSNPFSTPSDFYNIVRPQQDQRAFNDRISRQQYAQSRRLNQMAAQGPYDVTGNENAAPTGHRTGFMQFGSYMNTGGYFPPPTRPKER